MKRWIALASAIACILTLPACGSKQPGLDEVTAAIEAGNMTVEDALEKGWVTQEWADEYLEQRIVPASDKMTAHSVADFTTTTLSGESFGKEQLGDVAFFAFVDTADANAASFCQELTQGYEGVAEQGAEIVVCLRNEEQKELFENAPFPVILYNDSLQEAVSNHADMIEGSPIAASWYVNGAFLSAWYSAADAEELSDSAAAFVEMQKDMNEEDSEENGAAAIIG